jgi:hypothetical protein
LRAAPSRLRSRRSSSSSEWGSSFRASDPDVMAGEGTSWSGRRGFGSGVEVGDLNPNVLKSNENPRRAYHQHIDPLKISTYSFTTLISFHLGFPKTIPPSHTHRTSFHRNRFHHRHHRYRGDIPLHHLDHIQQTTPITSSTDSFGFIIDIENMFESVLRYNSVDYLEYIGVPWNSKAVTP